MHYGKLLVSKDFLNIDSNLIRDFDSKCDSNRNYIHQNDSIFDSNLS